MTEENNTLSQESLYQEVLKLMNEIQIIEKQSQTTRSKLIKENLKISNINEELQSMLNDIKKVQNRIPTELAQDLIKRIKSFNENIIEKELEEKGVINKLYEIKNYSTQLQSILQNIEKKKEMQFEFHNKVQNFVCRYLQKNSFNINFKDFKELNHEKNEKLYKWYSFYFQNSDDSTMYNDMFQKMFDCFNTILTMVNEKFQPQLPFRKIDYYQINDEVLNRLTSEIFEENYANNQSVGNLFGKFQKISNVILRYFFSCALLNYKIVYLDEIEFNKDFHFVFKKDRNQNKFFQLFPYYITQDSIVQEKIPVIMPKKN
ncbi:hypothetical protein M0813_09620 [Anaeramoeba flamelloides]|uniref:Uncharacterized protein n=1 Tax=Anaeramoeba flamelloides TaxID=1746091 RepID=A0ABQ8X6R4_9EUKA|nr:hypothetical protein M0813_09620 [Anaeramoeba flamelloides]